SSAPPNVDVTEPAPGAVISHLPRISGVALPGRGAGHINHVNVTIQRSSDGAFWNGRRFQRSLSSFNVAVTGTGKWMLTENLPPLGTHFTGSFNISVSGAGPHGAVTSHSRSVIADIGANDSDMIAVTNSLDSGPGSLRDAI